MSKNYQLVAAVALLLVLGIAGYLSLNLPSSISRNLVKEEKSVLTSLEDALSNDSLSIECSIKKSSTPQVAYIKNGQIRIDSIPNSSENSRGLLVTHDSMYAWTQKGGVRITLDAEAKISVEGFQKQVEALAGSQGSEMIDEMSNDKESCKNTYVDDSHFIPPSNVDFYQVGSLPAGAYDKSQ